MLTLTYGPPRSGKSYRLMDKIYSEWKKWKKGTSKYKHIYTNLNGIDIDFFQGFVIRYNKQDLEIVMQNEFTQMELNENHLIEHDGDYDKWAIENNIVSPFNNCLLIIDEAYNTFTKTFENEKGRFLSYHGHFNIDIDLLLQSKRQVNREYLVHVEVTYLVTASGKRKVKNIFEYKSYSTVETVKDNFIETVYVKFNPDIASHYKSGGTEIYKSFVYKKLVPLVILASVMFAYFFFFSTPKMSKSVSLNNNILDANQTKQLQENDPTYIPPINQFSTNNDSVFIRSVCYSDSCRIDGYKITLSEKNILKLLNEFDCKIILYEPFDFNYSHYYLSCSNKITNFLKPFFEDKTNEKNSNNNSSK